MQNIRVVEHRPFSVHACTTCGNTNSMHDPVQTASARLTMCPQPEMALFSDRATMMGSSCAANMARSSQDRSLLYRPWSGDDGSSHAALYQTPSDDDITITRDISNHITVYPLLNPVRVYPPVCVRQN